MYQSRLTRRSITKALFATPMILSSRIALAADPVKVGLIFTTSGPFASSGDLMAKAAALFMKHKAPALLSGQKIEIIQRDDGGPNPEVAKRLVQELIVRDRVQFIGGIQWTPNAFAIGPLLTQSKTPCVLMNAGTSSIVRSSPFFARTSHTIWQSCYPLGQWAARNKIGKAYTLVTDFAGGHDAETGFTKGFTEAGGSVVAAVRMPIQNPNFAPLLQRVRDTKPDALFVFHPGGTQTAAFIKTYAEIGLANDGIRLIGPGDLTSDEELPSVGPIAKGIITAHHYSVAGDRPANKEFLALWHQEYGASLRPNYMSVGVWDGMRVIATTIAANKGNGDPDAAMETIKKYRDDNSPRGPISIDPQTRDIVQNEYIREVRIVNGEPYNVELETIPAVKDPWKSFNPA